MRTKKPVRIAKKSHGELIQFMNDNTFLEH